MMASVKPAESLQTYRQIVQNMRRVLRLIGFDVFAPDFRPSWITALMYVDILTFTASLIYTAYLCRDDTIEMLKVLYVFGVPVQGFIKSSTLLHYKADIYALNEHICRMHRNSRDRWQRCLCDWTWRTDRVLRIQFVLYICTGLMFAICPLLYFAVFGEVVLNLRMEMPMVDAGTTGGYVTMLVFEVYSVFLAVGILVSVDSVFVVMCLTACAYVEMVRLKCDEVAEYLDAMEESAAEYRERDVHSRLLSILVAGLKAEGFIGKIKMYFENGCAVQLSTGGLSLAFAILVARLSTLFVAYPMSCSFLYMIMAYAFIGTLIESQSEKLCHSLSQMKWYLLSVKHRRIYLLMLQHSQTAACITLFGDVKLNVQTGMDILKSIYRAYMMVESTL